MVVSRQSRRVSLLLLKTASNLERYVQINVLCHVGDLKHFSDTFYDSLQDLVYLCTLGLLIKMRCMCTCRHIHVNVCILMTYTFIN